MAKAFIIALAVVSNLAWFAAVAAYPFIYVIKTGKFIKGVARSWELNLLFSVIMSLLIPYGLALFLQAHKDVVFSSFPTARGIVAILFLGWLPAFIICGIAYGVHCLLKRTRNRKAADKVNPVDAV